MHFCLSRIFHIFSPQKIYTTNFTDNLVQFLSGFAIFHKAQHTQGLWKIAKKPNPIVKFGCEIGSLKVVAKIADIRSPGAPQ